MTIASEGGTPEPTGSTALYEVPGEFERGYRLAYAGGGCWWAGGDAVMNSAHVAGFSAGVDDHIVARESDVVAAWRRLHPAPSKPAEPNA